MNMLQSMIEKLGKRMISVVFHKLPVDANNKELVSNAATQMVDRMVQQFYVRILFMKWIWKNVLVDIVSVGCISVQ